MPLPEAAPARAQPQLAPGPGAVDVILRDGRTLRLRAAVGEDVPRLVEFFNGLSPNSLYLRFHGVVRVDEALARQFVALDWNERGSLVGMLDDRVVCLGSWARLREPRTAEAAFVVADELHGQGIGTRLLERLAAVAAEVGRASCRERV